MFYDVMCHFYTILQEQIQDIQLLGSHKDPIYLKKKISKLALLFSFHAIYFKSLDVLQLWNEI